MAEGVWRAKRNDRFVLQSDGLDAFEDILSRALSDPRYKEVVNQVIAERLERLQRGEVSDAEMARMVEIDAQKILERLGLGDRE